MEQPVQQPGDVRALLSQLRNDQLGGATRRGDAEEQRLDPMEQTAYNSVANVQKANIDVVVRVRPLNQRELQRRESNIFHFPGNGSIETVHLPRHQRTRPFTFAVVFEPESTQADVFEHSGVKKLVNLALDGFTCTCLAYGQTGSGKTYTMLGPRSFYESDGSEGDADVDAFAPDDADRDGNSGHRPTIRADDPAAGVIPRAFAFLMKRISELARRGKTTFKVQAYFIEIYHEKIRDLLDTEPAPYQRSTQVRFRQDAGFYVENVVKVNCKSVDDLLGVLEQGVRSRHMGSTTANETSSRSHAILTLEIDSESTVADKLPNSNPEPEPEQQEARRNRRKQPVSDEIVIHRRSKLTFVDLAGSEKLPYDAVQRLENGLTHYMETHTINRSLLVLGNCISALSDPKKRDGHIPFRDSNLTKLLSDSLGGNGYTLMITCVTPSSACVSESLNSLRYAQRAKNIRSKPQVKIDPQDSYVLDLRHQIRSLREENYYLREQLDASSRRSRLEMYQDEQDSEQFYANYPSRSGRSRTPFDNRSRTPVNAPMDVAPYYGRPVAGLGPGAGPGAGAGPVAGAGAGPGLGPGANPRARTPPRNMPTFNRPDQIDRPSFGRGVPFDRPVAAYGSSTPRMSTRYGRGYGPSRSQPGPLRLNNGQVRGGRSQPTRIKSRFSRHTPVDYYYYYGRPTPREAVEGRAYDMYDDYPDPFRRYGRLPPVASSVDPSLYEVLQEYIVENEMLRRDRQELLQSRGRNLLNQRSSMPPGGQQRGYPAKSSRLPVNGLTNRSRQLGSMNYGDYGSIPPPFQIPEDDYGQEWPPESAPYDYEYDVGGANAIVFRKQRPGGNNNRNRPRKNYAEPPSNHHRNWPRGVNLVDEESKPPPYDAVS